MRSAHFVVGYKSCPQYSTVCSRSAGNKEGAGNKEDDEKGGGGDEKSKEEGTNKGEDFPQQTHKVFADLWKRNFYLTEGDKFGADFLLALLGQQQGDKVKYRSLTWQGNS